VRHEKKEERASERGGERETKDLRGGGGEREKNGRENVSLCDSLTLQQAS